MNSTETPVQDRDSSSDTPANVLSRREALRQVTAMLGGVALTGGTGLLATVISPNAQAREALAMATGFSAQDIRWLNLVADTILPETNTPGAGAAAVGPFLALIVDDCYTPGEQAVFREGMRTLERYSESNFGSGFEALSSTDRVAVLEHFDAEQIAFDEEKSDDAIAHYFRLMKELTLLGYFTSEIGATQALRYIESPGRFDPCYPREPGDPDWAPV